MSKNTRFISLLCVCILVIAMFAGCEKKDDGSYIKNLLTASSIQKFDYAITGTFEYTGCSDINTENDAMKKIDELGIREMFMENSTVSYDFKISGTYNNAQSISANIEYAKPGNQLQPLTDIVLDGKNLYINIASLAAVFDAITNDTAFSEALPQDKYYAIIDTTKGNDDTAEMSYQDMVANLEAAKKLIPQLCEMVNNAACKTKPDVFYKYDDADAPEQIVPVYCFELNNQNSEAFIHAFGELLSQNATILYTSYVTLLTDANGAEATVVKDAQSKQEKTVLSIQQVAEKMKTYTNNDVMPFTLKSCSTLLGNDNHRRFNLTTDIQCSNSNKETLIAHTTIVFSENQSDKAITMDKTAAMTGDELSEFLFSAVISMYGMQNPDISTPDLDADASPIN